MRDVVLFIVIFSLLPFCIARPYIGVLTWAWLGYMNPHRLTWGPAYSYDWGKLIALATLIGFAIAVMSRDRKPKLPREKEVVLLVLLWLMFGFTTLFAMDVPAASAEFIKICKVLLMTFLTLMLIDDRRKLRLLVLVITLSVGFYGVKGGVFSLMTGGQHLVKGPAGSFFGANNGLGLALNMCLPLWYFLSKSEPKRVVRLFMLGSFGLTAMSVVFTYSRGAFLGLAAVLFFIGLTLKFYQKIVVLFLAVILSGAVLSQIPDKWIERMGTIQSFEEDRSAIGRLEAWKLAWRVALDRPLTGGGFEAFEDNSLYDRYYPETRARTDVHSAYFEVLGENGFITFGIYMALMASTVLALERLARRFKRSETDRWIYYYSRMVQISIAAFAVSGAFLEVASFDMYYHLVALAIVLKSIARKQVENSGRHASHRAVLRAVPQQAETA